MYTSETGSAKVLRAHRSSASQACVIRPSLLSSATQVCVALSVRGHKQAAASIDIVVAVTGINLVASPLLVIHHNLVRSSRRSVRHYSPNFSNLS
jgi:hypothetical protein